MSFLDVAFDEVSNWFSGSSGGGGNPALGFVADVAGHYISADANERAARTVAEGYQAQAEAMARGNQAANERLDGIVQTSGPAVTYLRNTVAADPYRLTPQQQTQRGDVVREARSSLSATGMRGSGRAAVDMIQSADQRFQDNAVAQNLSRSDAAASQLASAGNSAQRRAADIDYSTGGAIADVIPRSADATASADVANAALKGTVVGSLSSFIAQDQKAKEGRDSRYKEWQNPDI